MVVAILRCSELHGLSHRRMPQLEDILFHLPNGGSLQVHFTFHSAPNYINGAWIGQPRLCFYPHVFLIVLYGVTGAWWLFSIFIGMLNLIFLPCIHKWNKKRWGLVHSSIKFSSFFFFLDGLCQTEPWRHLLLRVPWSDFYFGKMVTVTCWTKEKKSNIIW